MKTVRKWRAIKLVLIFACVIAMIAIALTAYFYSMSPKYYRFGYSIEKEIVNTGGFTKLRDECQNLFDVGLEDWVEKTNLPPLIASLAAQGVQVKRYEPPEVEIKLSGGFFHYGLIVVCDTSATNYVPRISNWRIRQIAPFIFEYKE